MWSICPSFDGNYHAATPTTRMHLFRINRTNLPVQIETIIALHYPINLFSSTLERSKCEVAHFYSFVGVESLQGRRHPVD